jgi:hypothetical protein
MITETAATAFKARLAFEDMDIGYRHLFLIPSKWLFNILIGSVTMARQRLVNHAYTPLNRYRPWKGLRSQQPVAYIDLLLGFSHWFPVSALEGKRPLPMVYRDCLGG